MPRAPLATATGTSWLAEPTRPAFRALGRDANVEPRIMAVVVPPAPPGLDLGWWDWRGGGGRSGRRWVDRCGSHRKVTVATAIPATAQATSTARSRAGNHGCPALRPSAVATAWARGWAGRYVAMVESHCGSLMDPKSPETMMTGK